MVTSKTRKIQGRQLRHKYRDILGITDTNRGANNLVIGTSTSRTNADKGTDVPDIEIERVTGSNGEHNKRKW